MVRSPTSRWPWVEMLLVLACLLLAGQLFPAAALDVIHRADVRDWTWQASAVVSAVCLLGLLVLRARSLQE